MQKQLTIKLIQKMLKDNDWRVRQAAMNACVGRTDIIVDIIERGLKDNDWRVRQAAMNACVGRTDITVDIIERGLKDNDCDVRQAAMNLARESGLEVPVIRTIEPSKMVYKKCIGEIIVCAEIPKDAQVRGNFNQKCRTDKATITDIIGELCGAKIGISKYDNKVFYEIGDEIVIDNFDYSDEECSTGFHFFNTLGEAQRYN